MNRLLIFPCLALLLCTLSFAQYRNDDLLPPPPPWSGETRNLALPADHEWATHFEQHQFQSSPGYGETMSYIQRLVEASPKLNKVTLGQTLEGYDIVMVIADDQGLTDPKDLIASGKPIFFAHAGIHSGEIDGKDAGLLLLRDLTVTNKLDLLKHVTVLFIPILNVDGHEYAREDNRINQRGPRRMGWRTNGSNHNLNRDFAKLDTPGVRAVVDVFNQYQPHLYYDLHVTDGMDYQYDITWGANLPEVSHSPAITTWIAETLDPHLNKTLSAVGHIPGPLIFRKSFMDWRAGLSTGFFGPRFSNGLGEARHVPSILVENHSLKPYDQRVFGTYVLMRDTLELLKSQGDALQTAIAEDRASRPQTVALDHAFDEENPKTLAFKGVGITETPSELAGIDVLSFNGIPETFEMPMYYKKLPLHEVQRPQRYYVSPNFPDVIARLKVHGIQMTPLAAATQRQLSQYRITNWQLATMPFEGRVRIDNLKVALEDATVTLPKGTMVIETDQPLGTLAMLLLEPMAPDSFIQWGFFHEIFQRTEYFELYAGEPLAQRMLKADPTLKAAFEKAIAEDQTLATNPYARLDWFFQQSGYSDQRYLVYPVFKE